MNRYIKAIIVLGIMFLILALPVQAAYPLSLTTSGETEAYQTATFIRQNGVYVDTYKGFDVYTYNDWIYIVPPIGYPFTVEGIGTYLEGQAIMALAYPAIDEAVGNLNSFVAQVASSPQISPSPSSGVNNIIIDGTTYTLITWGPLTGWIDNGPITYKNANWEKYYDPYTNTYYLQISVTRNGSWSSNIPPAYVPYQPPVTPTAPATVPTVTLIPQSTCISVFGVPLQLALATAGAACLIIGFIGWLPSTKLIKKLKL